MFKRLWTVVVLSVLVISGLSVLPALAQGEMPPLPGELVLGDLATPRGLAFDADGNLLVVVVGSGGDLSLTAPNPEDPSVEVAVSAGLSGKIVSIAPDGTASDLIPGLPSYATPQEVIGVYRVVPNGDSLWLVFSTGLPGAYWTDSVVELDAATMVVKTVINLNNFEATNDPDGNGYDTNVADIAWGADGTLYIVDAGGNDLLSWTAADGLQVVQAWPDNPVPTSIEVAENGDLYIGFLGAGLAPGAGKIEHWSGGELVETFAGLNTVTDILLDGDTLYAVQMVVFGAEGPGPGSVVMVSADGVTPVAEGLITPFGIAKSPDGDLYVTYGTLAFAPGMTGGVVKLSMDM